MLKRKRVPTPPPTPSLPFLNEPSPLDMMMMEREYKRKRTASITASDEPWKHSEITTKPAAIQAGNDANILYPDSEYKSANNILREIHTLHQHRLLFSVPGALPPYQSVLQSPNAPLSQSKLNISPSSERSRLSSYPPTHDPEQEETQVKERYEEMNRLLGFMFLSRRRQLGLEEQYAP